MNRELSDEEFKKIRKVFDIVLKWDEDLIYTFISALVKVMDGSFSNKVANMERIKFNILLDHRTHATIQHDLKNLHDNEVE